MWDSRRRPGVPGVPGVRGFLPLSPSLLLTPGPPPAVTQHLSYAGGRYGGGAHVPFLTSFISGRQARIPRHF